MNENPQYFMTPDGNIWRNDKPPVVVGSVPKKVVKFMLLNDVQLSLLMEVMEAQQNYEECAVIRDEFQRRKDLNTILKL